MPLVDLDIDTLLRASLHDKPVIMHNCQRHYQCQYSIDLSIIFSVHFQECSLPKTLGETVSLACCQLPADQKTYRSTRASDAGADSRSCARGDKSGYLSSFTVQKCNPSFCFPNVRHKSPPLCAAKYYHLF